MSNVATATPAEESGTNYLNIAHTVRSWLLTVDHKRIAILYLVSILAFFLLGGAAAVFFRIELMAPGQDIMRAETYNKLFTMHGIVMIFFFLIPSIPAVMGNFLVPMMIGARDVAFPRLNLFSWYLFITGGACALFAVAMGGVDTGWTFYTPYSSMYANTHVILAVTGAFIDAYDTCDRRHFRAMRGRQHECC